MSARRVWSAVGAGWVGLQGRGLRPEQREVGTEWKCILSVGEAGRADVELRDLELKSSHGSTFAWALLYGWGPRRDGAL